MLHVTLLRIGIEMSAPASVLRRHYSILAILCLLNLFSPPVVSPIWAESNSLPSISVNKPNVQSQPQTATELTDENIDDSRKKLESRLAEIHLQSRPESIVALQNTFHGAATPQELYEWEKQTTKLAWILEDHVNTLLRLKNIRKTNRDRAVEMNSWKAFAEPPPYPVSLLDSLRDAIVAKQISQQSLDVMRTTVEQELEEYSSSLKNSRKQVRLAQENLETSKNKPEELRKRWLLIMARLLDDVNQAGIVYAETRHLLLQESVEGAQTEIRFLEKRLAVAKGAYRFTEAELDQKLQAIDSRLELLGRELELAVHDEDQARRTLNTGDEAVREARSNSSSQEPSKAPLTSLHKAYEVRQVLFETADLRVQILKVITHLLKNEKVVWNERYRLAAKLGKEEYSSDLQNYQRDQELIGKWKGYIVSKITSLLVLIKSQQEKDSAANLPETVRTGIHSIIAAYQEQEALLRRGSEVLVEYDQLLQRRNEEAKTYFVPISFKSRAQGVLASISTLAGKIWDTELYVADETIIADGIKIIRPRSITIGKVAEALSILLVGSWLIWHMKKLLLWIAKHHLKFDENDAQLYSKVLAYLLFIGVLVGALILVNIPLAVFAFFGGALAIGVGFGAQNLINNFMSGLILMFGHIIRIGDVVEVDNHRGRVVYIGIRSSRIKCFDGVEMLVPNSHFMQQNVTNWTLSDKRVRYSITVGVAYGAPTEETAQIILKAVEAQDEVLKDPQAYVVFENFADNALTFTAYFWIEIEPEVSSLVVSSDIRHRINEQLRASGIAIPYPQRDIHVDTSQPIDIRVIRPD